VTYADGTDWLGDPVTKTITTSQVYDGWGRVIRSVDKNNGQVNTSYDAMGRAVSRTNPFTAGGTPGPTTTFQYDLTNKAMITTLPGGNTGRSDYSGSTVTSTDQVNRKIKRETDGLGRLIKVTEQDVSTAALTQETSYSYSLQDKLTGVNQGGQLRSYRYDAMGRLLYEKIPEQSATINDGTGTMWSSKYSYTEWGGVANKQDARGVITSYAYDSLHRATQVSYNTVSGVTTAPTVTYVYDYDVNYGTTATGKLLRVNLGSDYQERYTFDGMLRVSSAIRTIGTRTYTTSYNSYNEAGQLTQMTYPSTRQVSVTHDNFGRLNGLTGYVSSIGYSVAGQVTGDTLGNGVVEAFGYDANRLQLTSQTATKSGNTLMNLTYGYNATAGQMGSGSTAGNAGQLMSISGTIGGLTESAAYTYDNLGRLLTSNQTSNGSSAQRRFAYDRWGNRTAMWDAVSGGNQIQSITLQQSAGVPTNRIVSVTSGSTVNYTYDAAGNVTNDGLHSYAYDSENRIVSVDGGATASCAYDHQNRRYKKTVGSTVSHYVWEGGQQLARHDGSTGAVAIDYVYSGSRMIAKIGSGVTQYFLNDRLSVRLSLDTSGNITGRQGHLPFGEDFAETGTQQKQHFTSYERDGEIGADYAVNREYSQTAGRFGSADPYRASGYLTDPQSWNRYSYSKNDAINRKDPSGLDPFIGSSGETSDNGRSNPCGSFGPSFAIDGFEFSREMTCIFVFAAAILREVTRTPQTRCSDWVSAFVFGDFERKIAEAVFIEFSGDVQEGIAIAYVIKNRYWFLNQPQITDTLGFGPRGATIEQVLGAPGGQFPEYMSNGKLKPGYQRLFDIAWNSEIGSAACDKLVNAYTIVSAVNLFGFPDPFAAQGGGWFFKQGRRSPCLMCQFIGTLGTPPNEHNFWTIPYTNFTGGVKAPWY